MVDRAPSIASVGAYQAIIAQALPREMIPTAGQLTVRVLIFIDEAGRVISPQLAGSSGSATVDQAALQAIEGVRFRPAALRGEPVAVWVLFPMRFGRGNGPHPLLHPEPLP